MRADLYSQTVFKIQLTQETAPPLHINYHIKYLRKYNDHIAGDYTIVGADGEYAK